MKISYREGSLFDAPPGSCLVHACNLQGKWGAGVALEMRQRFPDAFEVYRYVCDVAREQPQVVGMKRPALLGECIIIPTFRYSVGCLFTSEHYGRLKDPPEKIVEQTRTAVARFLEWLPDNVPIYSARFNSYHFGVEWERTEALLLAADDEREWNVCTPV